MSSRIDVDEIRSKTTNGNLVTSPNGTGIFVPKKVPAFYAYSTGTQNTTDAAWTKVTLGTELFDNTGDYDTANSRFVAPVNGIYSFTTNLNWTTDTVAGGHCYSEVRVNGSSEYYTFGFRHDGIIYNDSQINGSVLIPLNANQYAEMWSYQDTAVGVTPQLRGGGRNYFVGHLVSGT